MKQYRPLQSYPYWWDTLPDRGALQHASELQGLLTASRFDVAVLGAGYTGLAAARWLARSGASVVVLERERVGWGASSRNGGQVLTGLKLEPAVLVARYGESRARELFNASRASMSALEDLVHDEQISCEFERTGHIQAASKPSHFDFFREEQDLLARVFGHVVSTIPPSQQSAELDTRRYHGLLVDEESRAINPARYVRGLALAAARRGAVIAEQTAVERMSRTSGTWTLTTSRGDVHATEVILATNGYTDAAAAALQRRFIPIGSYIVATEPLSEATAARILPKRRMVFDSKNFLYYFRLTSDRRLLFGGRAEFSQPSRDSEARAAVILRRGLATVFPELAGTPIDYAWGGNVAFTRDQLPHAGRLDGAYFAGGYCGHGIAMATYLGDLIARRAAGEKFEHPLMDDRFPPIPLYHGRPWFLPLAGAYFRFKDWIG
jgi:glycine/D-amino acid oxidase-like deaminating enzyme